MIGLQRVKSQTNVDRFFPLERRDDVIASFILHPGDSRFQMLMPAVIADIERSEEFDIMILVKTTDLA